VVLWDGADSILIYSKPGTAKLRNIAARTRVSLNLNSNGDGGDIVVVLGSAAVSDDPPADTLPEYVEKYLGFIERKRLDARELRCGLLRAPPDHGRTAARHLMDPTLAARLARHPDVRGELEANIATLASSIDGQRFEFQSPLESLDFLVGGYVVIEGPARRQLAQVLVLTQAQTEVGDLTWSGDTSMSSRVIIRHARGEGVLLEGPPQPFHDAFVRAASPDEVRAWEESTASARARLPIGALLRAPGVTHALDAGGFDRHTFLCGQSGSGKTYALGVLLEQLLLETSLRIVILDPNSDYARLRRPRAGTDPELAARLELATRTVQGAPELGPRYRAVAGSASASSASPAQPRRCISTRFATATSTASSRQSSTNLHPDSLDELAGAERPGAAALVLRARNLGLDGWGVWARDPGRGHPWTRSPIHRSGASSSTSGSLATREEQALVSQAVLDRLWARRTLREPILIVIDEAHNVCPAEPADPLTALATEHAVRIAAEGRKFGLYLLTAYPATAEGAPEHRLAVRQPRAHADELGERPRVYGRRAVVRAGGPARAGAPVPHGRGGRRGQALVASDAPPLRGADLRGGRRRRARDLGRAAVSVRPGSPRAVR